jgi:hypothetical protein
MKVSSGFRYMPGKTVGLMHFYHLWSYEPFVCMVSLLRIGPVSCSVRSEKRQLRLGRFVDVVDPFSDQKCVVLYV